MALPICCEELHTDHRIPKSFWLNQYAKSFAHDGAPIDWKQAFKDQIIVISHRLEEKPMQIFAIADPKIPIVNTTLALCLSPIMPFIVLPNP
jgi:hypothetical protein